MRIVWWNVQRLGATTDDARRLDLDASLGTFYPYDVVILCELTTRCEWPPSLHWNYRRRNTYQLCYGVVEGTGQVEGEPGQYDPALTPCYMSANYIGGNNFRLLVSRTPGLMRMVGSPVPVYFFHAPSGGGGGRALAYLACDLNARHGANPWLLIGDFNIDPVALAAQPTGVPLGPFITAPAVATHQSGSKLDYVLSNNIPGLTLQVGNGNFASDHQPILVSF